MKLDMFLAGHIIILEKDIVSFKALSLHSCIVFPFRNLVVYIHVAVLVSTLWLQDIKYFQTSLINILLCFKKNIYRNVTWTKDKTETKLIFGVNLYIICWIFLAGWWWDFKY